MPENVVNGPTYSVGERPREDVWDQHAVGVSSDQISV